MAFGDVVQHKEAQSPGSTGNITATLDAGATAGNLLVCMVGSNGTINTPSGMTLTASDVNFLGAYMFHKISTGGETAFIADNAGGDAGKAMSVIEFEGPFDASPVDATGTNRDNSTSATSIAQGGVATTNANDLLVAMAAVAGVAEGTHTFASVTDSFTHRYDAQGDEGSPSFFVALFTASRVVSSTVTMNPTFNYTGAGYNGIILASFKQGSAPSNTVTTGILKLVSS